MATLFLNNFNLPSFQHYSNHPIDWVGANDGGTALNVPVPGGYHKAFFLSSRWILSLTLWFLLPQLVPQEAVCHSKKFDSLIQMRHKVWQHLLKVWSSDFNALPHANPRVKLPPHTRAHELLLKESSLYCCVWTECVRILFLCLYTIRSLRCNSLTVWY